VIARPAGGILLSRPRHLREGRGLLDRFDQVFGKVFKGLETSYGTEAVPIPGGMAAQGRRALPHARADGGDQVARLLGRDHGDAEEAARGAAGAPPGRQQVDRHRRHLALRPWRLQSGRRADRRRRASTAARSRSGTSASSGTSTAKELGTRNIKVALRRLRRFAREGAADELDIDGTIDGTARKGWLDIRMRPERHNAVKLLLFLDVGGSMDPHIRSARSCSRPPPPSSRTSNSSTSTIALREACGRTIAAASPSARRPGTCSTNIGHDYKLVFVGDASMSPYEITHPGGSVEHFNEEAGAVWMQRLTNTYPSAGVAQPDARAILGLQPTRPLIRELMQDRMYPLTLDGSTMRCDLLLARSRRLAARFVPGCPRGRGGCLGRGIGRAGPRLRLGAGVREQGRGDGVRRIHIPTGRSGRRAFLPDEHAAEDRQPARPPCPRTAARCSRMLPLREAGGDRAMESRTERWLAIVPFWASWPFEVLLLPRFAGQRGCRSWTGRRPVELADVLAPADHAATTTLFNVSFPLFDGLARRAVRRRATTPSIGSSTPISTRRCCARRRCASSWSASRCWPRRSATSPPSRRPSACAR
jgi:hypothetical protein